MAFITNVDELQALLDACSLTQELELLIQSILIPDHEWVPMVYVRLSELTAQEIPVSILFYLSSSLIFSYCCLSFHVTEVSVHQSLLNVLLHRLKRTRIMGAIKPTNFISARMS